MLFAGGIINLLRFTEVRTTYQIHDDLDAWGFLADEDKMSCVNEGPMLSQLSLSQGRPIVDERSL